MLFCLPYLRAFLGAAIVEHPSCVLIWVAPSRDVSSPLDAKHPVRLAGVCHLFLPTHQYIIETTHSRRGSLGSLLRIGQLPPPRLCGNVTCSRNTSQDSLTWGWGDVLFFAAASAPPPLCRSAIVHVKLHVQFSLSLMMLIVSPLLPATLDAINSLCCQGVGDSGLRVRLHGRLGEIFIRD